MDRAQLLRELVGVHPQVEPDRRERDAPPQVVGLRDRRGARLLPRPQQGALGAVDDAALGDAHVAAEDELLLDDVLDRLDRDVQQAEAAGALVDPRGKPTGGRGIASSDRNAVRMATSILRGSHAATSPVRRMRRGASGRATAAAAKRSSTSARAMSYWPASMSAASTIDERSWTVIRRASCSRRADGGGGRADGAAGGGRVGLRLAVGERERRQRARDDVGHVGGGERAVVVELDVGHLDRERGGHVDRGTFLARQCGRALELEVLQDLGEIEHVVELLVGDGGQRGGLLVLGDPAFEEVLLAGGRPSSSASHGSGFSSPPCSGARPTPSRRRSAM